MKKLFFIIFISNYLLALNANELECKKFDIKCKTNKFINETKEFQKKGFEDSKKQLSGTKKKLDGSFDETKDKIIEILPKKK
jgi:hypothetical protein